MTRVARRERCTGGETIWTGKFGVFDTEGQAKRLRNSSKRDILARSTTARGEGRSSDF